MHRPGLLATRTRLAPALLCLLLASGPLAAQQSDGFLFGRPAVTLGVYGGYAIPGTGSDIFDFTREQLTVEESDFHGAAFGAWLGHRLTERIDVMLDVDHAGTEIASEFRDWVDQQDRPIEQTTSFDRTSATLNVRLYPWARGRSVGRYVWIPGTVSPYVGAGAGLLWYGFQQEGDFVDFQTLDIFRDRFTSDGSTGTWRLFAGVDVSLGPRFLATARVRHGWASAEMNEDFVGFEPIDLSGFEGTVGLAVRL